MHWSPGLPAAASPGEAEGGGIAGPSRCATSGAWDSDVSGERMRKP